MDFPGSLKTVMDEVAELSTEATVLLKQKVNLPAFEQVVTTALTEHGPYAVVPALIDNVDTYVTDPSSALLLKIVLKLVHRA